MNLRKTQFMAILLLLCLLFLTGIQISRSDLDGGPQLEVRYVKGYRYDPTLALYLPLLEGKGSMAFDISGFKNHGTLQQKEAATWLIGGGLHFNGVDDRININASASLQSAYKSVIIQLMWDGKGNDSELYLYDDGWAYNGSMIIYVHSATSQLCVEFRTKAGTQKNLWQDILANEVCTAIFRFDGTNYRLWLNGVEKSSSLEDAGELGANNNVGIGSDYVGYRRYFSGNIYFVQVFNRSLSDNEISCLNTPLRETPRADPGSKYVIGGWVAPRNDSLPTSALEGIQIYLNQTYMTSLDKYGGYLFTFDLPRVVGNYTYSLTLGNTTEGEAYVSAVVDQVVVSELGSTSVWTGSEAIAWFKLRSEFDGQPMESGSVVLTEGLTATWNANESRWEYRETRNNEGSRTLYVESITWYKYGITALNPNARFNVTTIQWQQPPWYSALVTWLVGVGPTTWGVVVILLILATLIHFGIIEVRTDKSPETTEYMRKQVDSLLQIIKQEDRRFSVFEQFLHKLLDENPPPEVLEYLRDFLLLIVKQLAEHPHTEDYLDHKGD